MRLGPYFLLIAFGSAGLACSDSEESASSTPSDAGTGSDSSGASGASGSAGAGTGGAAGSSGSGGSAGAGTGGSGGSAGSGGGSTSPGCSLARGSEYFGQPERFNRLATEPDYEGSTIVWVSPDGSGDGTSETSPSSVDAGIASAAPGVEIRFLPGTYDGCWGLDQDQSGTYDQPIVLRGMPNADGTRGAVINCCNTGRRSCFNLEGADYVAITGFELVGGKHGVRAVGLSFDADQHQRGVAWIDNEARDDAADPFFSGQSDWIAVIDNLAHGAGDEDGHGIYLSNGSDWMWVCGNELWDNEASDFQINADPLSACSAFDEPYCHGSADDGLGAGVSEFVLVERNYLHHSSVGPNFTSVRNSIVVNNLIGYASRHLTSFWQETQVQQLASSNNLIAHNLFVATNNREVFQITRLASDNRVVNNLFLSLDDAASATDGEAILVVRDGTGTGNEFAGNVYLGGRFESFTPPAEDSELDTFAAGWFDDFPSAVGDALAGARPAPSAPFAGGGVDIHDEVPWDSAGQPRPSSPTPGPFEPQCIVSSETMHWDATCRVPTGARKR